jgi:FkbM family methyltransferase
MNSQDIQRANDLALDQRFFTRDGYTFRHISPHNKLLHEVKWSHPYRGFVDVEIEGVEPFVMFSNNDDLVAQIYFWFGPDAYETTSLKVWRNLTRRAKVVVDVGAYTGVYSLAAARANPECEVYAFEPIRRIFGRLVVNITANQLSRRIRPIDRGLSDEAGEPIFHMYFGGETLSTGSSLKEKKNRQATAHQRCEVVRFDDFAKEQSLASVDLLKLDVEQAEIKVLHGMSETLSRHRPDLLMEILPRDRLPRIIEVLEKYGYEFALLDDHSGRALIGDRVTAGPGIFNAVFTVGGRDRLIELLGEAAT